MTARELLAYLRAKGVEVTASGDGRLVINAPKGTITEDIRGSLTAHKVEMLEILKKQDVFAFPAAQEPRPEATPPRAVVEMPSHPHVIVEDHSVTASVDDEIAQLETEMRRLRTEEEARRAQVEADRMAAEHSLRIEQEKWRQQEEEIARRRAEQERQRIETEARERADEEKRRQIADQEIERVEQDLVRMRSMEAARRAEADEEMRVARAAHEVELSKLRQAEEEQASRRTEQERRHLETEARKRAQEEEFRRRAEMRFRAVEEEIGRIRTREQARERAAHEAQRLVDEAERRRSDEDARRKAEVQARLRAEEESRLRAEIEAQLRAEAAERWRAEDEARRQAEEEARRRAEDQAQLLAAEKARRLAEEEAQRRAEEETRRQAEEEARLKAEEEARQRAEEEERLRAEQEERERAETAARDRAELVARIRAEIEARIRAEEEERRRAQEQARRRAEQERVVSDATPQEAANSDYAFELEHSNDGTSQTRNQAEWFEVGTEDSQEVYSVETAATATLPDEDFGPMNELESEFKPVSVPEVSPAAEPAHTSSDLESRLGSSKPSERAAAVGELPEVGGEDGFLRICAAFDDQSLEVRSAAAHALFELQEDRAAAFTRALREATPERSRKIASAIATSGLANEAIKNLTGESRDKTYDAFSLLFLMSKAGEVQPLIRAIEDHPNIEVRLAVVKLLALCGQPDVLPEFRRMAVRGSLPPEVRSAVMEAIYQISSQSPTETASMN